MIDATKVIWISFFMSFLAAILVSFGFYFFVMPKLPPPPEWQVSEASVVTETPQQSSSKVEVPNLVGSYPGQARLAVENLGLSLVIEGETQSQEYPEGVIVAQRPLQGSVMPKGNPVYVTIAGEAQSKSVSIPFVKGLDQSVAKNQIVQAGLYVGKVQLVESDTLPKGIVIKTMPPEGSKVAEKTPITLFVSKGAGLVTVPSLIGKYYPGATSLLDRTGLRLGNVNKQISAEYPVNKIIGQSPKPGAKVPRGSKVNITVATVVEQMY